MGVRAERGAEGALLAHGVDEVARPAPQGLPGLVRGEQVGQILGRALKDFADRDEVVIATKLRHPMRPGPNGRGLSRKAIMVEVEHSLRRLGTEYIDLYQIQRMPARR
nr:hypothetical protein GCM10020063_021950 [Dactylosporangium thailandense]